MNCNVATAIAHNQVRMEYYAVGQLDINDMQT